MSDSIQFVNNTRGFFIIQSNSWINLELSLEKCAKNYFSPIYTLKFLVDGLNVIGTWGGGVAGVKVSFSDSKIWREVFHLMTVFVLHLKPVILVLMYSYLLARWVVLIKSFRENNCECLVPSLGFKFCFDNKKS